MKYIFVILPLIIINSIIIYLTLVPRIGLLDELFYFPFILLGFLFIAIYIALFIISRGKKMRYLFISLLGLISFSVMMFAFPFNNIIEEGFNSWSRNIEAPKELPAVEKELKAKKLLSVPLFFSANTFIYLVFDKLNKGNKTVNPL